YAPRHRAVCRQQAAHGHIFRDFAGLAAARGSKKYAKRGPGHSRKDCTNWMTNIWSFLRILKNRGKRGRKSFRGGFFPLRFRGNIVKLGVMYCEKCDNTERNTIHDPERKEIWKHERCFQHSDYETD